jgi:hypothetical protein
MLLKFTQGNHENFKWFPNVLRCSQAFSDVPKCSQMFPSVPRCSQMIPNDSKCSQMFSIFSTCSQHFSRFFAYDPKCLAPRFDWKAIRPKHQPKILLTESPFNRTPFDRNTNRKFFWPNPRLTERRLIESSFYRNVIWPICFSKNGHFTESTFDKKKTFDRKKTCRKFIWPKAFFEKWSFDRFFFQYVHLTESFFRNMFIWPKVFFSKYCHLTEFWEIPSVRMRGVRVRGKYFIKKFF